MNRKACFHLEKYICKCTALRNNFATLWRIGHKDLWGVIISITVNRHREKQYSGLLYYITSAYFARGPMFNRIRLNSKKSTTSHFWLHFFYQHMHEVLLGLNTSHFDFLSRASNDWIFLLVTSRSQSTRSCVFPFQRMSFHFTIHFNFQV